MQKNTDTNIDWKMYKYFYDTTKFYELRKNYNNLC